MSPYRNRDEELRETERAQVEAALKGSEGSVSARVRGRSRIAAHASSLANDSGRGEGLANGISSPVSPPPRALSYPQKPRPSYPQRPEGGEN